jgi:sporulation protein YlmC with PRC-barrel domain
MLAKYMTAGLVGSALLASVAFAQTPTATSDRASMAPVAASDSSFQGNWRASKLVGVNVYNDNNEKIGDIQELIVDKSGKVENVVLGVGGFLGMGEHYVAVPMEKLKWVNEPVRTSSTTAPADKSTVGASNRSARAADENWYPDHAVFNATKDQLKAMPQFKYN